MQYFVTGGSGFVGGALIRALSESTPVVAMARTPEAAHVVAERGGLPKCSLWIDHGRAKVSTTHIDNLISGLLLAIENGSGGEAYYVSDDEPVTQYEFVKRYLATVGAEPTDRSLPGWVARSAANLVEPVWQLVRPRRPPPFTRLAAYLLSRESTVRIDKARRDLGYEPVVTIAEGLARLTQHPSS